MRMPILLVVIVATILISCGLVQNPQNLTENLSAESDALEEDHYQDYTLIVSNPVYNITLKEVEYNDSCITYEGNVNCTIFKFIVVSNYGVPIPFAMGGGNAVLSNGSNLGMLHLSIASYSPDSQLNCKLTGLVDLPPHGEFAENICIPPVFKEDNPTITLFMKWYAHSGYFGSLGMPGIRGIDRVFEFEPYPLLQSRNSSLGLRSTQD